MVEVVIKDSPIHGKGVFAASAVAPGELIGLYEGTITNEKMDDPYILWLEDNEGRYFGVLGTGDLKYLNHSEKPNALVGVNSPYVFCARPISAGDEITISYGDDYFEED
jgi:SET domain-containing protein